VVQHICCFWLQQWKRNKTCYVCKHFHGHVLCHQLTSCCSNCMGWCIVCFLQLHDSGFSNKLLSMALPVFPGHTSRQFGSKASSTPAGNLCLDKCSSYRLVQPSKFFTQLISLSSRYSFCNLPRFSKPSIFCIWFFCRGNPRSVSLSRTEQDATAPERNTEQVSANFAPSVTAICSAGWLHAGV